MLKTAVHLSMFCKKWDDDVSAFLPRLKEIGFDAVEVSLFGADTKKVTKAFSEAHRLGLKIICGTGIEKSTDISSADKSIRMQGIDYLKQALDIAAEGEAMFLNGVLYAPWQDFSGNEPIDERQKRSAESLQIVAEYAKQYKIGLNCEVINRFESDFFNTLDDGAAFIKKIGAHNVKLLADTFHMNIEEDNIVKAFEKNSEYLGCIHICENHRGVPGTGHLPWTEIISTLKRVEYDGYLDMECFSDTGNEVADALSIWRSHGKCPFVEAEHGYRYITKLIENSEV